MDFWKRSFADMLSEAKHLSFYIFEEIWCVIVTIGLVKIRQESLCTHSKVLVTILSVIGPCSLGKRCKARKKHVLDLTEIRYILSPEITLNTQYLIVLMSKETVIRIQSVNLFHGKIAMGYT